MMVQAEPTKSKLTPAEIDLINRANDPLFSSYAQKDDATLSEEDVFRLAKELFPLWYYKRITGIPWPQVEVRIRQTHLIMLDVATSIIGH